MLPYDEWAKSQGIGTEQNPEDWDPVREAHKDYGCSTRRFEKNGKDEMAEALVYNERQKLRKLLREHPKAPKYRIPCFYPDRRRLIGHLLLSEVLHLNDMVQAEPSDDPDELKNAVQWRMCKHHSVRWNWRGSFEMRNRKEVWVPGDLGKMLYPSTKLAVSEVPYQPII
ncbi:hypothetical protein P3342_003944 [Pyrenophora teres f. teres]|nr:hypothetical protein P3342_003944 [Pyrenophora teres f. teres]